MGAEVISGAPDRAPFLGDLWVPPEASSSAPLAGAPLLTPLLSQVEARLQVPRLFILTLLYPGVEPGIFVFL